MTSDPIIPPIEWNGLRPASAGPRYYAGPEVAARAPWTCPACAADNSGLLADGCTSCGNGGGAKHVGIDPIVVKQKLRDPEDVFSVPVHVTNSPLDLRDAFMRWITQTQDAGPRAAFEAGWQAAQGANGVRMTSPVTDHTENVPTVAAIVDPTELSTEGNLGEPLPGTAKDRTLLAALEFFKDQVYSVDAEEAISGEWLKGTDLAELIAEIRTRLEETA